MTTQYIKPSTCPCCEHKLEQHEDYKAGYYCNNPECQEARTHLYVAQKVEE
ncbi:hypothetical protein ACTFOB_25495 [Bacillus cereus group sp. MYBK79-1]|uniref:hypothetical protein n=1 Tax=unclassified Bacillus cereus group TaxID=2750818 RepID=UPI003F7AC1BD